MNTFFTNPTLTLAAAAPRSLTLPFNVLRIESVSGDVLFRFDAKGDWLTARAGRSFEALPGELWQSVEFLSAAGGTVIVTAGRGSFGGGSGSGSGQTLSGDGAPTTPPDDANAAATYFDRTASALYNWNTTSQAWV